MAESPRMEVRRLRWIMRHVEKLSPAGLNWLRSVLYVEPCSRCEHPKHTGERCGTCDCTSPFRFQRGA